MKLDTNGDGFLDAEELVNGMHKVRANLFELLDRDPDWQNLMQSISTNADGKFDF